jgi:hypothetical protein
MLELHVRKAPVRASKLLAEGARDAMHQLHMHFRDSADPGTVRRICGLAWRAPLVGFRR